MQVRAMLVLYLCGAGAWVCDGAAIVTSVAGVNAAGIQGQVDAFRTSLGALNPNAAGSFGSGRREINWDGVPDAFSAPNNLPANFFNVNSPRGVVLSTPGTGFQVSANAASGQPVEFGNIDPSYPFLFATFSPQRLFTALGSNITDVTFFVPGSNVEAVTTAFGVVFTDIDVANETSLQFFDPTGVSLGTYFAPAVPFSSENLSFLGVRFTTEFVGRVRITSGTQVLQAGNLNSDLVVMDDFIYAEPTASEIPEPLTMLSVGIGLAALAARRTVWRTHSCVPSRHSCRLLSGQR